MLFHLALFHYLLELLLMQHVQMNLKDDVSLEAGHVFLQRTWSLRRPSIQFCNFMVSYKLISFKGLCGPQENEISKENSGVTQIQV